MHAGWFRCDESVRIARPRSNDELLQLIKESTKVKGAGVGHSWWTEQACSGNSTEALQIVLTEYPEVLALSQRLRPTYKPLDPKDAATVPIHVDESALTVSVAGGVGQRVVMDWLAEYRTQKSPTGYVLLATSQYVDQTVAGAIATGTHGSTLVDGSLSSQIVSLDLALANGTLLTLTPEANLHLWRAAQVSVGRLGVITAVTFKIRKNQPVERGLLKTDFAGLASKFMDIQNAYNAATSAADKAVALAPLDLLQCTWFIRSNHLWEISFRPLTNESSAHYQKAIDTLTKVVEAQEAAEAAAYTDAAVKGASALQVETAVAKKIDADTAVGSPEGVYRQVKDEIRLKPDLGFDALTAANIAEPISEGIFYALTDYPTTQLARDAYIIADEALSMVYSGLAPLGNAHAQYELVIPMEVLGDCFSRINQYIYVDKKLNTSGFSYFSQVRFVSQETGYISNTNDGPRAYLNIEDHNSFNNPHGPVFDEDLQKLVQLVKDTCDARLHWGKAGWPRYNGCFDGATVFPATWCDFGCAVEELDPTGKFSSLADVWSFNAADKSSGTAVPFSRCCTPQGFDQTKCTCAKRTDCTPGPPKPCTAEC
ncbi:hypothetical protein CVIRNUC_004824 [Coccomyxa viridis]|uniref:FAD-binding PCMH-type domain-containing protein n=1 Tax=Coccomyxa viridis TaxID=1274662 RepID=A0AAV1I749_9CHLO|nr:hypothetical protein CVIRNUC_004824 [Coccomyxa viridis]